MQAIIVIALGAAGVALMFFFLALLTTLFGGFVGFAVGIVFPFVIDTINTLFHTTLTGFEVGATLGFFGSFFRANQTNNNK